MVEKESFSNKKSVLLIKYFLIALVLLQPIFDCYYFYTDELASIIGFTIPPLLAVFWVAAMLFFFLILDFRNFRKKSTMILFAYFAVCIVYFIIHHLTNRSFNSVVPGDFGYSMVNEAYYVVRLILPFIILYLTYELRISKEEFYRIIEFLCVVVSGTIVISNLFKISLSSYTNLVIEDNIFSWFTKLDEYNPVELTSKGFFSYANQISALLMFLTPILLYRMASSFKVWRAIAVIVQALAMIIIGTKTAAYGLPLELVTFALVLLFSGAIQKKLNRSTFREKRFVLLTLCLTLALCAIILPRAPVLQKQTARQETIAEREKLERETLEIEEPDAYYQLSLEERAAYIEDNYYNYSLNEDFVKKSYPYQYDPDFWYEILDEPLVQRMDFRFLEFSMINRVIEINDDPMDPWFGISATRETNIFKVERDYIAQYYSMGIIGVAIFMLPFVLLAVFYSFYSLLKKNRAHVFEYLMLSMAIDVVLLIGLITGNCLDGLFITIVLGLFSGRVLLNIKESKQAQS